MDTSRAEILRSWFENMDKSKRLMQTYFARVLGAIGVSPTQAHILGAIQEDQPISLKALAGKSFITPGAITQLIDALEQKHMITRTQDTRDRRITYINLAPDGKTAIEAITKARNELMTEGLSALTDEELKHFTTLQQKMMAQLQKQMHSAERKE